MQSPNVYSPEAPQWSVLGNALLTTLLFPVLLLSGCTTMQSPPARPIPDGAVAVGGSVSGPLPPEANATVAVGRPNGSLLAEIRTTLVGLEASVHRRVRRSAPDRGAPRAYSVGLRGGGLLAAPPFSISQNVYGADATDAAVEGKTNSSLLWGGVSGRYSVLANPNGFFVNTTATALLESERLYELVPYCSVPINQPCSLDTDAQTRALSDEREVQGRLFLGGQVGYRFEWDNGLGVQLQIGGQFDPFYAIGGGRDFWSDLDRDDEYGGWLSAGSLQVGLHVDHLFGL